MQAMLMSDLVTDSSLNIGRVAWASARTLSTHLHRAQAAKSFLHGAVANIITAQ